MREPLDVGAVIEGRFELVQELGQGGFARVFAARQVHLDRLVAIKVLNVSLDAQNDDSFEKRFLHEAKMAAQISHPNAVTIHEFGFAGELRQPYIAMEMLQGHDLDHELYDGPMLPSRVLRLLLPVLDALAAGHALQIVHKDLKPANLFICNPSLSSELMVVLDYGVARWNLDSSPKFTATGAFTGTPAYMAPEYAREQVVTPAVDVYQMGLIIPEMLTGLPLVMEETPWDCLMVHAEGKVEIPLEVRTSPIGPIIEQALQYDYRERLPDAAALRSALEQVDPDALDEHFRERGLGTVAPETMPETIPSARVDLSSETHRTFTGATNAAWPPQPESAQPQESAHRPQASPGTVLVPVPGQDAGRDLEPPPQEQPPAATQYNATEETARDASGVWRIVAAIAIGIVAATAVSLYFARSRPEPDASEQSTPVAAVHRAEVNSTPTNAVLLLNGRRFASTPTAVEWKGEPSAVIELRIDGHQTETFEVTDGDSRTIRLKPLAREVAEKSAEPAKQKSKSADAKTKPTPRKSRPRPKAKTDKKTEAIPSVLDR